MKVLFNEADRIAIVLQGKETDAVEELTGLPVAHMREGDAYEIRMPQEHVIEDNVPSIVDRLEVLVQKLEEKKGREDELLGVLQRFRHTVYRGKSGRCFVPERFVKRVNVLLEEYVEAERERLDQYDRFEEADSDEPR